MLEINVDIIVLMIVDSNSNTLNLHVFSSEFMEIILLVLAKKRKLNSEELLKIIDVKNK